MTRLKQNFKLLLNNSNSLYIRNITQTKNKNGFQINKMPVFEIMCSSNIKLMKWNSIMFDNRSQTRVLYLCFNGNE